MADQFVEEAKNNMSALERLFKGLPGIQGYVDKELRRNADWRLRQTIADELEKQKRVLFETQQKLLQAGGLKWLDDIDRAVNKLQILIDRMKTASAGYAGLFDAVKVKEEQLDELYEYDAGMLSFADEMASDIDRLASAIGVREGVPEAIGELIETIDAANRTFDHRHEAILQAES